MKSIKGLKNSLWAKFSVLVIIGVIAVVIFPTIALASDPYAYAPPQLDEQQKVRWVNSLPQSRLYLARMWGINQETAEFYGALYKPPTCGFATIPVDSAPLGVTVISITDLSSPLGYKEIPIGVDASLGSQWGNTPKYIEEFNPIKIDYSKPENDIITAVIQYNYPPGLDKVQATRWGQALPSARIYLARLWDIPKDVAVEYGAGF